MNETMKQIAYEKVVESVASLCEKAAHELPEDVMTTLRQAVQEETDSRARHLLELMLENARVAREERYPLCQDTGVTVAFVELGSEVYVVPAVNGQGRTLTDAINDGVKKGYQEGYLRKSIVDDPVKERKNTTTNTPAIIYIDLVEGDQLKISLMLKGGGCENKSQVRMLKPADGEEGVKSFVLDVVRQAGADACPPYIVGVGIGGDFEKCAMLAKKALLRPMNSHHKQSYFSAMEIELLERINKLDIGPQGMGGRTTALGVLIETYPCHIASLPVAVNIECHSHRHGEILL